MAGTGNESLASQEHWDKLYEGLVLQRPTADDPVRLWINRYISRGEGKDCLEIGCFPGRFLTIFGDAGYTLHGIDLTPRLNEMPSWLSSYGYKVGDFRREDFLEADHAGRQYDVVSSFGFIEHFADWADVLVKHAQMVRAGGRLIVEVPNFAGDVLRALRMFLDLENYERHNTAAMYPQAWEAILALLDFEVCFAGYLGDFAFWVDKPPDNPVVQDLISVVLRSKEFLDKAGLHDSLIRPYCGLVAAKKSAVPVATLLARADVSAGIDRIVAATRTKDAAAAAGLRGMLPLFRSWCDYRAAQMRRG